ncbi:MAG: hypothetical protein AB8G05_12455 [Oligoflexales bacterium]
MDLRTVGLTQRGNQMGTAAAKREKSKNASKSVLANDVQSEAKSQGKSVLGTCHNCNAESRCSRRQFSEQAWTVLLLWNEINPSAVDQPICGDCYEEMRDILIDRTDEIERAMQQQSDEVARIKQQLSNLAS